jgi:Ca2+-binding RTX toxin-like protein
VNYSTLVIILFNLVFIGVLTLGDFNTIYTSSAASDVFKTTSAKIAMLLQNPQNIVNCSALICTGTNMNDIIIGSFLSETISGLDGNDKIQGNNGNDMIFGGNGNDIISGGGGFDKLFGQDGDDILIADASASLRQQDIQSQFEAIKFFYNQLVGNDPLEESENTQVLTSFNFSGFSKDPFRVRENSDPMFADISLLSGGNGNDFLLGQNGNEIFVGGPGKDYFDCNEGIDTVLDYNPREDTANVNCENLEQDDTI